MNLLEDRLAAAGDQLDHLIDTRVGRAPHPSEQLGGRAPHRRALTVAASTVALVAGGLWLMSTGRGPADARVAEDRATTEAPAPTATAAIDVATTALSTTPASSSSTIAPTSIPVMAEPVADAAPLAIGESVMLGAAQQLQAGGFVVNASESRQGDDVVDVLRQLAAAGQIGETVVLQVGTNGPVAAETYRAIVTVLTDVDRVVFLTVHAPGKGWIEENNALIWGVLPDHPNVDVLDWDGLAASGQVPGMAGDGIHLGTAAAQQSYANYVFGIIGRNDLIRPLPE